VAVTNDRRPRIEVLVKQPNSKEDDMYEPLIRVFNAAFAELENVKLDGLEDATVKPIAINHSTKSPASNTPQADGAYRPDIALISWKKLCQRPVGEKPQSFTSAGQSPICTDPWNGQGLGWRELLSTVEVKHETLNKDKANDKLKTLEMQYGDAELKDRDLDPHFGITTHDRELAPAAESRSMQSDHRSCTSSTFLRLDQSLIVDRLVGTRASARLMVKEGAPSMLSHRQSSTSTMSVRSRTSTSQSGPGSKKLKRDADEVDASSAPDAKKARLAGPKADPKAKNVKIKYPHRVQTALYAAHMLSSSLDKTHSIAMNIIGMFTARLYPFQVR